MWPVLSGILIAIITAAVTVYLGKRSSSGRIETSEAKDLWDTLRTELGRLQTEAVSVRAEASVARQEMTALREEATKLRAHIMDLEIKLSSLITQLEMCHKEEINLRRQMATLGSRRRKETGT